MITIFKKKNDNNRANANFELVKGLIVKLMEGEVQQDSLTPETMFEELGFDSIKFINLLLELENLIEIDLEKIAAEIDPSSIRSLDDVVKLLDKLKKS